MKYTEYLRDNVQGKTGVVMANHIFTVGVGRESIIQIGEDFVVIGIPGVPSKPHYTIPSSELIIEYR